MRPALPVLLLLAACSPDAGGEAVAEPPAASPSRADPARPAEAEAAPAAAASAGETRSFRDWDASCDNVRTCTAFGFHPESDDGSQGYGFIRIERAGGGAAEPVVTLAGGGWDTEAPAAATLEAAVDGGRSFALAARDGEPGPYSAGELRGAEAWALIAALRNGRTLSVKAGSRQPAAVSLNGAAAALLWIDDRQGRVGTAGALARPGPRPASAVPAPPSPPLVRAAPTAGGPSREVAAASLAGSGAKACMEDLPEGFEAPIATADRLGGDLWLWSVPCGWGAYNITTAFFFGDAAGRELRPVPLSAYTGEGDTPAHHAINAAYDPKTGRITAFAKGRGVGDCGSEEAWVWDGRAFVRVLERTMGRCQGVLPRDWPVLYRAEVR